MLKRIKDQLFNLFKPIKRRRIDVLTLMRKDKLLTGYVSEVYVHGLYVGMALENMGSQPWMVLTLSKNNVVCDQFTSHHYEDVLVLEPTSTLYDMLADRVCLQIDGSHLPLEI